MAQNYYEQKGLKAGDKCPTCQTVLATSKTGNLYCPGKYEGKHETEQSGGKSGGSNWKPDPFKNRGVSMRYAVDLVLGGKVELKDLNKTADKIIAWVEKSEPVKQGPPASTDNPDGAFENDDIPF